MLINDKSTFAIECELRHKSDNFHFCNFRFWIAGTPIGDWNQEVVLGVLVYSAQVFMLHKGNRHLEQADRMSAEQLWRHIDRFTHSDEPEDLQIGLEGRYRPRFLIHDIADDSVATVYEVVVVERADGGQRLLWKSRGGNDVHEVDLPKLTVDMTISSFLRWAEHLSSET